MWTLPRIIALVVVLALIVFLPVVKVTKIEKQTGPWNASEAPEEKVTKHEPIIVWNPVVGVLWLLGDAVLGTYLYRKYAKGGEGS